MPSANSGTRYSSVTKSRKQFPILSPEEQRKSASMVISCELCRPLITLYEYSYIKVVSLGRVLCHIIFFVDLASALHISLRSTTRTKGCELRENAYYFHYVHVRRASATAAVD
jgi:hypothetical protein